MSTATPESSGIICTVDVVLLTIKDNELCVALLKRDHAPFAGKSALPGVYVHPSDLGTKDAAKRALRDKAGIVSPYLEQLQTFDGPDRDPRGWSISVAYYALVPLEVIESSNNPRIELRSVDDPRMLPFDHSTIVETAVSRLRVKGQYSSLPCFLAGETFSIPHLQRIYEIVRGEPINKVTFRRKLDELDILEEVSGVRDLSGNGPPAKVYKLSATAEKELALLKRGM